MRLELTTEARAKLDAHMDAVEKALERAGKSRSERRAVLDDLEAQIREMLAARSSTPTEADVQAVLAMLDPPVAYGGDRAAAPPPEMLPRCSQKAIWGAVCLAAGLTPPLAFFLLITLWIQPATRDIEHDFAISPGNSWFEQMYRVAGFLMLFMNPFGWAGTVLGWLAFTDIRQSQGKLTGRWLALFDGSFYPMILLVAVLGVLPLTGIAALAVIAFLIVLGIRLVRRRTSIVA